VARRDANGVPAPAAARERLGTRSAFTSGEQVRLLKILPLLGTLNVGVRQEHVIVPFGN
jgi:hypothetical protein